MSRMELEIRRQFEIWPQLPAISRSVGPWLLVGCGSSYHLAELAARRLHLRGAKARALTASELVRYPEYMAPDCQLVALSRSGETSEVLWAIDTFRRHVAGEVWGISCQEGSRILQAADHPICLAAAREEAVAMTGAFTATLWAIDQLTGFPPDIQAEGQSVIGKLDALTDPWTQRDDLSQVVFLGSGPLFPLAREGALKLTETALEATEAYVTLEVRHGPKARFGTETLVVILGAPRQAELEARLVKDLEGLGARVWHLQPQVREMDLAYVYAPQLQWFALKRALAKGLEPDCPRQLTRHVELD